MSEQPESAKRRYTARIAVGLILLAAVAVVYLTPLREYVRLAAIRRGVESLRAVWYGPLIFTVGYAVGCVVGLPATAFIIAGAFIWGWVVGGTLAYVGGLAGAAAAFGVAHFVGGGLIGRLGSPGARLQKVLHGASFHTLLVLRVVPLFPFPVFNYTAGVAGVRFWPFFLSTMLGLAPANYIVAYSADALIGGSLTAEGAFRRVLTAGVLIAVLALVPLLLKRRVERAEGLAPSE